MDMNTIYNTIDFDHKQDSDNLKTKPFYTETIKPCNKPCTLIRKMKKWLMKKLP